MKIAKNLFIIAILLGLAKSEDITLMCDVFDSEVGEHFCTVSGFVVSHSQNVLIENYALANTTNFMKFYDSRLLYVPHRLFDVFTDLISLDVAGSEILDVSRNTFAAAKNLSILNLSQNNITQITSSVFMGASNLIRLDLSHNKLTEINEYAFRGLDGLDKLLLSHNQLKDITKEIFLENSYLEVVALDNNLIEYIEPEVFSHLRRIRDVNLSDNRIYRFHPNTFQNAYSFESLVISSNRLNEFSLFNKSISQQLNLDYNNLTSIRINGTKFVSAGHNKISSIIRHNTAYLESLMLRNNSISDLCNITGEAGLLELDLSYNPIGSLNISTFDHLKRLRKLQLRATGIHKLSFGMFSKQSSLETLDLAFNNLTELNLDMFVPYLSTVWQFYVDGNNLTEIQGRRSFMLTFQNLRYLGISKNRFNCTYLHTLLTPPNLSPWVSLHIEPDNSSESVESSHIRDVSCVSNVKASLEHARQELQDISALQSVLNQSLQMLRLHERRLELYLLVMKIAVLAAICLAVGAGMAYFWKQRQADNFARRGGSIVFHSTTTMDQ